MEVQRSVVEAAISATEARVVGSPDWLNRPGRSECGPLWELVQDIYHRLTGLTLPETMPPRERRTVDAVLDYDDGSLQILEVDETQHFNECRALTLRSYPDREVAFDRQAWLKRCDEKKRLEGGGFAVPRPPLFPDENGRHQQRAFRDALCDLLPPLYGFHPTARIAYFEGPPALDDLLSSRLIGPTKSTPEADDSRESIRIHEGDDRGRRRTQRVTRNDLKTGQIRIPNVSKDVFPGSGVPVTVVLRGWETTVPWRPRYGPDRERSGVLRIGRDRLAERVSPNEVLELWLDDHGRIVME